MTSKETTQTFRQWMKSLRRCAFSEGFEVDLAPYALKILRVHWSRNVPPGVAARWVLAFLGAYWQHA